MRNEVDELLKGRRPFHWPLEFPEVFALVWKRERLCGDCKQSSFPRWKKITGALGTDYREYLVEYLAHGKRGHVQTYAPISSCEQAN